MANSPVLPFFAHNNTVKAWCVTGNHRISTATQADFDARNFIDGYNLRLDYDTQTSMGNNGGTGALKFSFITPMLNTKYKVLVQPYGWTSPLYPQFAHVLNSDLYPKTTPSFWIRLGFFSSTGTNFPASGRTYNQPTNIVLWSNAASSLGVVVI